MKRRTFIASAAALLFEPVAALPGPVTPAALPGRWVPVSDYGPLFIGFDPGSADRTVVGEMLDGHFVHYREL